jgi:hypothetical protein
VDRGSSPGADGRCILADHAVVASWGDDRVRRGARIDRSARAACAHTPEAYEEQAFAGVCWRIRGRTLAHVVTIGGGRKEPVVGRRYKALGVPDRYVRIPFSCRTRCVTVVASRSMRGG